MAYEDRPEVHGDEKAEVETAMEGEDEDEDVVGNRLKVSVDWVESV